MFSNPRTESPLSCWVTFVAIFSVGSLEHNTTANRSGLLRRDRSHFVNSKTKWKLFRDQMSTYICSLQYQLEKTPYNIPHAPCAYPPSGLCICTWQMGWRLCTGGVSSTDLHESLTLLLPLLLLMY